MVSQPQLQDRVYRASLDSIFLKTMQAAHLEI